jgi:hypothetical protein
MDPGGRGLDIGRRATALIIIKAGHSQCDNAGVFHDYADHRAELNHKVVCVFFHGARTP